MPIIHILVSVSLEHFKIKLVDYDISILVEVLCEVICVLKKIIHKSELMDEKMLKELFSNKESVNEKIFFNLTKLK